MEYQSNPRTLSVILGGGRGTRLHPLTEERAKPAVPLGGKYRLIDVPISNCLNSGLNQIYVVTQFQGTSLHQHVSGTYVFDRFGKGFVEILAAQQTTANSDWYQGTADAVRQNLHHFDEEFDEILILSGDQLYQMDFRKLLDNHRRTGAAMSIAVLPVNAQSATSLGILQVNEEGRVLAFHEKPVAEKLKGLETDQGLFDHFGVEAEGRPYLASMGIYVFNRELLAHELQTYKYVDFGKDLFPASLKKHKVQAYVFDGYWEDIGTVKSFHEANLDMATIPPKFSFNSEAGLVYTRPRTLPGIVAKRLQMQDSIVADGCVIGDLELNRSILGLRSVVGDKVRLTRTLVMGADYYEYEEDRKRNRKLNRLNIGIGNNVEIENAIVDKNVRIGDNVVIKNPDRINTANTPYCVVRDGVICIKKGAIVPSGARLGVD